MSTIPSWPARMVLAMAPLALLAACAAINDIPEVDWQHGARRAWVVGFYSPSQPLAELPACLANLSSQEYATRQFVKVRYHHAKQMHVEVAELTSGLQVRPEDQVELWPANCAAGKLSRISKVFPAGDRIATPFQQ